MSLPIILGPKADQEFEEAATWYEQQAELGTDFVHRVQETLDRIEQMPEAFRTVHRDIRRGRVRRFPYSVFYRILADRIEVIAVIHDKRDSGTWKSRG